jgi:hypothetical protein
MLPDAIGGVIERLDAIIRDCAARCEFRTVHPPADAGEAPSTPG